VRHHDGVAVGRRLGGNAHADDAGDAAAIVDDHLLSQAAGHFLGDDARHRIDTAAGGKRNDQGHGAGRIGRLRRRAPRPEHGRCGGDQR
jgi:hypothetical protein